LLYPGRADFYVEKIDTVREHRIHVFDQEVIRVQTKQPTPGEQQHPWIRSASSGWTLVARPDLTALVPRGARTIAKQAVAALGYEFGAVDLAVKTDGGIIVWEVNTQPGMGDGTADVYARILMQKYGG
jgi:glutathione synthase/RimK-type ligase-like ATP-grasp enzyme